MDHVFNHEIHRFFEHAGDERRQGLPAQAEPDIGVRGEDALDARAQGRSPVEGRRIGLQSFGPGDPLQSRRERGEQRDRERAPGSIGSSSHPSRVFRGQRMAGRMGGEQVTVRNLHVVGVIPDSNLLLVKGSVPGAVNGYLEIHKRKAQ